MYTSLIYKEQQIENWKTLIAKRNYKELTNNEPNNINWIKL